MANTYYHRLGWRVVPMELATGDRYNRRRGRHTLWVAASLGAVRDEAGKRTVPAAPSLQEQTLHGRCMEQRSWRVRLLRIRHCLPSSRHQCLLRSRRDQRIRCRHSCWPDGDGLCVCTDMPWIP